MACNSWLRRSRRCAMSRSWRSVNITRPQNKYQVLRCRSRHLDQLSLQRRVIRVQPPGFWILELSHDLRLIPD
ncbi:hypothetical protein SESBI_20266 [Sesbania bispinosa]|nr:hypothetical protein SESBI_20266 [Sesbania bispinosa]